MGEIRTAMAEALPPIHGNKLSPGAFEQLASGVQGQVDYVTANCKLPEAADHQLHVVLERILDGIAVMKSDTKRAEGAVKIVQALDLYGANFNHAGWKPLKHQAGEAHMTAWRAENSVVLKSHRNRTGLNGPPGRN